MLKHIKQLFLNVPGWHTNRKIIVIESDDWGSIRMPSRNVFEKFLKAGYPVNLNPFERYDSLASEQDLNALFNVLSSNKNNNGVQPIITANCVVANPDFDKIKEDNFEKYHFELITETFKKYPNHSKNFELWHQAKNENLFFLQFHAREHLNVSKFMKALQLKDRDVLFGFNYRMPGSIRKGNERNGNFFVEATNYINEIDKAEKLEIYLDGLRIFEKLFGYKSESIIPPNYIWNKDYYEAVSQNGVRFIQGISFNVDPVCKNKIMNFRYTGKLNTYNQLNLVRNCNFEPAISNSTNPVIDCLAEIELAFKMSKPAIINSHRINYVGFIDKTNRDRNLKYLSQLIKQIIKRWPDVEFMTTIELGNLILNKNNSKLV